MAIHPSSIIADGAQIDPSADIGPFCIIGPHVRIGARTRLLSHVVIQNHTTLGTDNVVYPFASLGANPQDLKFNGEPATLIIGSRNVFRESVTISIGTATGHMQTLVGDGCLMMAQSHVAHDCKVGNGVIMANSVALAGHVEVGDHAILGGLSAVHQFCRLGRRSFLGGGTMVARDIPPFCMVHGSKASLRGLNMVGLKRDGLSKEHMRLLHQAYVMVLQPKTTREEGLLECEQTLATQSSHVAEFCAFVRSASRGITSDRLTLHALEDTE